VPRVSDLKTANDAVGPAQKKPNPDMGWAWQNRLFLS
jgi:hypothetical protein